MKPGTQVRIEGGEYDGHTGVIVQESPMTYRVELEKPPCSWHRVVRLSRYRVVAIDQEERTQ